MTLTTSRQRTQISLSHQLPDRTPVDFLATTEIWNKLIQHYALERPTPDDEQFYEAAREEVLRRLNIDCRVISYDMFYNPPAAALPPGGKVDWWNSLARSTPNRMWRAVQADGSFTDAWGRHSAGVKNDFGAYEELASSPLSAAGSILELQSARWPQPDWWNFAGLPALLDSLDQGGERHIRFRAGSIFEVAWQLRGMEAFLLDLVTDPPMAAYIMDRLTEITLANLQTALDLAGERIDMIYYYDDVATQTSLLISKKVWRNSIRPRHQRIIDLAHKYNKPVMYHCDGAISFLLPELVELGIDVLNPVQVDAGGMDPALLKSRFGEQISFHGGIDIINTLRTGTPEQVQAEVRERIHVLGAQGGYILASSHHIQPDTPLENILAMYDLALR